MTDRTSAPARSSIRAELEQLRGAGRWRERPVYDTPVGRVVVANGAGGRRKLHNWASNDYLGCTQEVQVRNESMRALRSYGTGAGAAGTRRRPTR